MTQLAGLERDAPRPDAERSALFVDDFAATQSLALSGWRMRYLLPETGQTWIAAFTTPAQPGAILFGEWTESDDGYAYHSGSLVVSLLAGLEEPS